jgi:Na+/H+ antiporter NhaA
MARSLLAGGTDPADGVKRPLRAFIDTEVGSASVLLAAALAALLWANSGWGGSYEAVWSTDLSIRLGDADLSLSLREWINDGLLTFFFFVIGLEIRRELDVGELRDRSRLVVPMAGALGGMVVPALIYLGFNAGTEAGHGWGVVMATDTAFALGILALVGRRWSARVRVFLLTLVIVDDVGALLVIAFAYTAGLSLIPLLIAIGLFGLVLVLRYLGLRRGQVYLLLGVGLWLALFHSGVHPTIAGAAMGLLAPAYPPARTALWRAAERWRSFREQPTPQYARTASRSLREAISPNERLQQLYHPWTSFLIVPLFALANAGVALSGELLSQAARSPVTQGIVAGLVLGKVAGITGASWLVTRRRLGGFAMTLSWPVLFGAAAVAGIGFTVSLFIAEYSFSDTRLAEAKVGILAAAILAAGLAWLVFSATDRLPDRWVGAPVAGTGPTDLADPVDPDRDHIRGPVQASVTLVEYGDYECPYCGRAEPVIRELLAQFGNELRYVFRHLPLADVHPHAPQAAEAAEAAAAAGQFWPMHDLLFTHQAALTTGDLVRYAASLGLTADEFLADLHDRRYAARVARDVESAEESGATGTPTLFVNGRRHRGPYDLGTLTRLVRVELAAAPGR